MTPEQHIFTQDLTGEISKYLPIKDLLNLAKTSKKLNRHVNQDIVWQYKIAQYFGLFSSEIAETQPAPAKSLADFKKNLEKYDIKLKKFIFAFTENNLAKIEKLFTDKKIAEHIKAIESGRLSKDKYSTYHPLILAIIY